MALGLLAGDLKRKEMLSGRLADIHGHLFIATAILQFYQHGSKSKAEQLHAEVALQHSLYTIQEAFLALFANFPNRLAAGLVSFVTFPSGRIFTPASDELKTQLGDVFMDDFAANPFRDYLKTMVYYNTEPDDVTGRMEHTYQTLLLIEPLWHKFKKSEHDGSFDGLTFEDHVVHASQMGEITEEEAEQLIRYNALRFDSLLTDVFDEHLHTALERINPHSLENAVHKLTDYAELKNNAVIKNNAALKNTKADDNSSVDESVNQTPASAIYEQTGDANPNHGYEQDGNVKSVAEQDTIKQATEQTSFADSNPQGEALSHRSRDAETILSERMSNNHHTLSKTGDDASQVADQAAIEADNNRIDANVSIATANANANPNWHDGLQDKDSQHNIDENDKA